MALPIIIPPNPINTGSGKENMEVSNADKMEAAVSMILDGFQSYQEANTINGTINRSVAINVITGTKVAISINIMNIAVKSAPSVNCLDWFIDCTLLTHQNLLLSYPCKVITSLLYDNTISAVIGARNNIK